MGHELRVLFPQLRENLRRCVRGTVVDDDDLMLDAGLLEDAENCRFEVDLFVLDGDDNRDVDIHLLMSPD